VAGNWRLGLAFALVTAVMWGLLPLGLKAVLGLMDPLTITWYRFSISAAIALAWYGFRSGPALRRMLSRPYRGWALTAVLGLLGNYMLYVWGLGYINAGAAQVLIQIATLLLLMASVFVLGERLSAVQWLGVAAFSAGMLLFFHQRLDDSVPTTDTYRLGAAMIIGAAVVWTAYGVAQKQLLHHFHAGDILLLICLGGSFALLPAADPLQVLDLDWQARGLLLFCGLNTIVAYGCFGLAMSHWDASRVSAVIPLAPLLTLLFTWLLNRGLGLSIAAEPLDWLGGLGALLVMIGCALATLSRAGREG
jgi:drug/metabolite transporter (DMT)-like permease